MKIYLRTYRYVIGMYERFTSIYERVLMTGTFRKRSDDGHVNLLNRPISTGRRDFCSLVETMDSANDLTNSCIY